VSASPQREGRRFIGSCITIFSTRSAIGTPPSDGKSEAIPVCSRLLRLCRGEWKGGFNTEEHVVEAPFTGILVGVLENPVALPGHPLCHLARMI